MLSKLFSIDLVRNLPWPDRRELSFLRARTAPRAVALSFHLDGLEELDQSLGAITADEALTEFLDEIERRVRVTDDFQRTGRASFSIRLARANAEVVADVTRRLEIVHAASVIAFATRIVSDEGAAAPLTAAS